MFFVWFHSLIILIGYLYQVTWFFSPNFFGFGFVFPVFPAEVKASLAAIKLDTKQHTWLPGAARLIVASDNRA